MNIKVVTVFFAEAVDTSALVAGGPCKVESNGSSIDGGTIMSATVVASPPSELVPHIHPSSIGPAVLTP